MLGGSGVGERIAGGKCNGGGRGGSICEIGLLLTLDNKSGGGGGGNGKFGLNLGSGGATGGIGGGKGAPFAGIDAFLGEVHP